MAGRPAQRSLPTGRGRGGAEQNGRNGPARSPTPYTSPPTPRYDWR